MSQAQMPSLRIATPEDASAIDALMKQSGAALFPAFYGDERSESAVRFVAQVDPMLLSDGTFFVLEADGEVVGCGGWSRRHRLYTGSGDANDDDRLLDLEEVLEPRREIGRQLDLLAQVLEGRTDGVGVLLHGGAGLLGAGLALGEGARTLGHRLEGPGQFLGGLQPLVDGGDAGRDFLDAALDEGDGLAELLQVAGEDLSLSSAVGEDGSLELGDTLEQDTIPSVELEMIRTSTEQQIRAMVAELDDKEREVIQMRFGLDGEKLHLLIEGTAPARALLEAADIVVAFQGDVALRYRVQASEGGCEARRSERLGIGWAGTPTGAVVAAADVLELAIPLGELRGDPARALSFRVLQVQDGVELARHPESGPIEIGLEEVARD